MTLKIHMQVVKAGPDQSVYDAVNAVRARSNQPKLQTNLTQAEMREAIRMYSICTNT